MLDRAGNLAYDTVRYEPTNLTFDKNSLSFGKVRVTKNSTLKINMKNFNFDSLLITKVYKKGTLFTLSGVQTPFKLAPNQDLTFNVTYTPTRQSVGKTETDTIFVETTCVQYKFLISGSGIIPVVAVQDWNFKSLLIGTKKCIEDMSVEGLKIDNTGSDVMTVLGVSGIKSPFILEHPTVPPIPFTIKPGESEYLKSICFIPSDTIDYSIDINIITDAYEGDSICNLKGKGTSKPVDPGSVEDLITKPFDLKIVPNPSAEDYVNLVYSTENDGRLKIELYDLQGQLIRELINEFSPSGMNQRFIYIGEFPQGVYNIKMTSGGFRTLSEKFVIVR